MYWAIGTIEVYLKYVLAAIYTLRVYLYYILICLGIT